jgi:hypothetical protein
MEETCIAINEPSLCIPRVLNNIDEPLIRSIFDKLALGKIKKIDIIERRNEKNESFKRVFIHFEKWFQNENAKETRARLISGKDIKIVYDSPWYWKVSVSKLNDQSNKNTYSKQTVKNITKVNIF